MSSGTTPNTDIPWLRFWCPLGGEIRCESNGGFLVNPEDDYGKHANPNVYCLEKILPEIGPVVLCGEPGIGKSTELRFVRGKLEYQCSSSSDLLIWLIFRDVADFASFREMTIQSELWAKWKSGDCRLTLVIDGVDEGLLRIGNFVNDLTALLKNEAVDRLRLVLACRTAEWPIEQGRRLLALWPSSNRNRLVELCPLRRVDVIAAASSRGCDPETFISELVMQNVVGLAARPLTLFFLLGEFCLHGNLPASHRELYEIGTKNLVREVDPVRLELLRALQKTDHHCTDLERLNAARRLAALFLLTGRSAVRVRGGAFEVVPANELLLEETFDSHSVSAERISHASVVEALESALFTSLGERRFGFAHQTFAECLAGQHLSNLPLIQLRRLICQRDLRGEHVIPQLAELAAWVAGYHMGFCERLVAIEPEVLLRSDVTRLQGSMKARLVTALLEGAERSEIFDSIDFGAFLGGLNHPGLADQLRTTLSNSNFGIVSRRIALSIVQHCKVSELFEVVLRLVSDNTEPQTLRDSAASTLEDIIPDDSLDLLEPLARGGVGEDPNDTIRGCALRRLVPIRWSVRDALSCLIPRTNENFVGAYQMFLEYELPKFITDDDVESVLIWLCDRSETFDHLHPVNALARVTIRRAFSLLDRPNIASALVSLWLSLYETHVISSVVNCEELKDVFDGIHPSRLQFVTEFLNTPRVSEADAIRLAWDGPVLNGEKDLEWLLDEILACAEERQPVWARVINRLRWGGICEGVWEKLLLRIEQCPALAREFSWLRAWDLDEPIALEAKADWEKQREWQTGIDDRKTRNVKPDRKIEQIRLLNEVRSGNAESWFELWQFLASNGFNHVDLSIIDVTSYPGWELLDEEARSLCKIGARVYLIQKSVEAEEWTVKTWGACAGVAAVSLLMDEWKGDVDLSEVLKGPWLKILVGRCCHNGQSEIAVKIFELLYDLNSEKAASALLEIAGKSLGGSDLRCSLRVAKNRWDKRLSEGIVEILDATESADQVLSGLELLAECDIETASAYVLTFLSRCVPSEDGYPIGLARALVGALRIAPREAFPIAVEIMENDESLRRHVWTAVLHRHGFGGGGLFSMLDEHSLAELYLILCDLFTPDCDLPWKGGTVTPEMEARRMRGQIPELMAARATEAACSELLRLASLRPASEWIHWTYRNAVTNLRRRLWQPPAVEEVKRILQQPTVRWINSEDDLLDLVLESLERFQRSLTGQSLPAVETLWRWDGAGQNRSNFQPKDEEALSDDVARWLRVDIGANAGVVVNREVQPRRGNRTDVIVEAIKAGGSQFDRFVIVIEVKGCWHTEVKTAIQSQLVDDYLRPNGWRCGIYLVGWFVCDRWEIPKNRLAGKNFVDATTEVNGYAEEVRRGAQDVRVEAILLDCRL